MFLYARYCNTILYRFFLHPYCQCKVKVSLGLLQELTRKQLKRVKAVLKNNLYLMMIKYFTLINTLQHMDLARGSPLSFFT